MNQVRLDPDSLRNRGARLAELGDRVGQTYAGLRDSLAQAEGSWGDDDLGVAFAREFKPQADNLLAGVRAMEESLRGTAAGIVDAAGQFEAHDRFGASRVGTTAASLAPIGEPTLPWPEGSSSSPAGPQGPVTADPAATFPAAANPAYPTDRADPAESPIPGGSRTPDASVGRSTPEGGPQRGPSDRAAGREGNRGAGGPGSGNSGKPAADPGRSPASTTHPPAAARASAADSGRRPPASAVFPPAVTRDAPPAPGGRQAGARSPGGGGRRDTPWSGQPPRTAGPPAGAEPRPPGPRFGSPPRRQNPTDESSGRDRRRSGARPAVDPVVGWLARTLAEHHDVRVAGFDTPGLQVPVVREFVAAVDRVLTDYPVIALDVVAVAELDAESGPVRWSPDPGDTRGTSAGRSITLDQRTALESRRATGTGESAAESAEPAIYLATLREFGRALDCAGGGLARRQAQRVLIAEYLRLEAGHDSTLAEVVRGYRRWRAVLAGDAADAGEFDVSRALGAAFADVVLRGDEASRQARALHAVLVDATSRRG